MDENNTPQGSSGNSPPLEKNEYVMELFSILQENGKDTKGLAALIGHVSEMENFVTRAEQKIAEMKLQLADMKEVQNHPVKTALQNAIKTLENKVAAVKEHLSELKHNIAEGCKNAVTAFKEKGITALSGISSFFNIRSNLEACKKENEAAIRADVKAIEKIEAFSTEYHKAGRAVKNMARMVIGKQPIDAKKEAGKLAKAMSAPYRAEKAILIKLNGSLKKTISQLAQLEATAAKQAARSERPDMLAKIAKNQERVEREKLELPTPERTKAAELGV